MYSIRRNVPCVNSKWVVTLRIPFFNKAARPLFSKQPRGKLHCFSEFLVRECWTLN